MPMPAQHPRRLGVAHLQWIAVIAALLLGAVACKNISTDPDDSYVNRFSSGFSYSFIPGSRD